MTAVAVCRGQCAAQHILVAMVTVCWGQGPTGTAATKCRTILKLHRLLTANRRQIHRWDGQTTSDSLRTLSCDHSVESLIVTKVSRVWSPAGLKSIYDETLNWRPMYQCYTLGMYKNQMAPLKKSRASPGFSVSASLSLGHPVSPKYRNGSEFKQTNKQTNHYHKRPSHNKMELKALLAWKSIVLRK